ncbi:MAG: right-handed parallel beta-helix repeat-containing protein [Phycisphaerales bacterium]|nr:right-handed parallel beta-helix repeat-containing protein [Planctomycetota bacterium]
MRSPLLRGACSASALAIPSTVLAGILYVNAAGPAGGNGSSWASPYSDLQSAIAAAKPGDQIWVARGIYKPHPTDRTASFQLKNGVGIYGGFAGVEDSLLQRNPAYTSTLSGEINSGATNDNSFHVVRAENADSSAILDGFLITAGQAVNGQLADQSNGGGLYIDASLASPTIRNCTFSNNAAVSGGGAIYLVGGSLRLDHCFFFGNRITGSAGGGGAIGSAPAAAPHITLADCVFSQNFTLGSAGGGALNATLGAIVSVDSSTFYNNSAPSGTILAGAPASATFRNCVMNGPGGAAAYFSAPVTVTFCLVPGGAPGVGNINASAVFVNAPAVNYRLAAGSPGIDAGSNTLLPPGLETDYDYNPRVLNGAVDMGAFEFVARTCTGDLNKDGFVDDSDFVLFAGAYNNFTDRFGDFNADLLTDDSDFVIFAGAYDVLVCP